MKYKYRVCRGAEIILGLIFTVMSLNYVFGFFSTPTPPPEGQQFLSALAQSGYFFPVLKATEFTAGVLLLLGTIVPFATVLLAPIVVNIFLFHVFLAPGGLPLAVVIVALEILLGIYYWPHFRTLFHTTSYAEGTASQQMRHTQKQATESA